MLLAATLGAGAAETRDPRTVNPPFPRIGTCYGAALSWKTWEQDAAWWSKLDLIIINTTLPEVLQFNLDKTRDEIMEIESSVPLGLVDHRKWNTPEYLLAGYPLHGKVKAGTTLTVELRIAVRISP